jgi:hypothetical protein
LFPKANNPVLALSFLHDLQRPPWTLTAWQSAKGAWIETQQCRNKPEASSFISKHCGRMIRVLLGYSRGVCPHAPKPTDLLQATGVALAIPIDRLGALPVQPSVWIEGPDHGVAMWRYLTPVSAHEARRSIAAFAPKFAKDNDCRADPLPLMIPLPGCGSGFELVFNERRRFIDMLTLDGEQPRLTKFTQEEQDETFVRGDQATAGRGLPMIKKGWVPGEVITIFLGPPKQGKSMGVAKLASYIVSGGSWEPGGWRPGWWDGKPVAPEARGSVIICEEEDPRLETLARIKAAIGLPEPELSRAMAKVYVRASVPDISAPRQLKQITELAEHQGDNRMISLSPFSRALRLRSYTQDAVRDKIAPIQQWIRGKGTSVVAIVHIDNSGRTSGSQVIPQVCRSGIKFEDGVMSVALANSAKMGVSMPFKIEETVVTIDGTPIDTARILFK